MAEQAIRPVSEADKVWALRQITQGLARKFGACLQQGWSDDALASELFVCWHVSGGSYIPGKPHVEYAAAGLKVWVSWQANTYGLKPTWQGQATIARIRQLYRIPDPEEPQLPLL